MTTLPDVNLVAVIVATALNMVLGMVWYSRKAFGAAWMQLSRLKESDFKNVDMRKSFATGIVATLITVYMLNALVQMIGAESPSEMLSVAFFVWLATILPGELHGVAWEMRPVKLLLINSSNALLSYFIAVYVVQNWAF